MPTVDGPVWLKAIPAFAAAEPAAIAAFAEVDPDLVPTVLASAPGRLLLADVPGTDCWDASAKTVADAMHRLATAQARIGQPPHDIPDRCPETLAAAVRDLLDGPVGTGLSPEELRAARSLQWRWEMLADCGLPDTVVHGDFTPATGAAGTAHQWSSTSPTHIWAPQCSTDCARSTTCRLTVAAIRHALACTRTRDGA